MSLPPWDMRRQPRLLCIAAVLACALSAAGQLPLEPKHDSGQNVTAAFEGWYKNPDGSFGILIG
jgi:hypothetical protein